MRPIDADALLKNTKAYFGDCIDKQDSEIIDNTILVHNKNISKIIKQAPTVEERPRGEWIKTFRCKGENINTGAISSLYYYDCSKCKYRTGNQGKEFYFCPNCGADMRGEGE